MTPKNLYTLVWIGLLAPFSLIANSSTISSKVSSTTTLPVGFFSAGFQNSFSQLVDPDRQNGCPEGSLMRQIVSERRNPSSGEVEDMSLFVCEADVAGDGFPLNQISSDEKIIFGGVIGRTRYYGPDRDTYIQTYANPYTGESSCPDGFPEPIKVYGTLFIDWGLQVCFKKVPANTPSPFTHIKYHGFVTDPSECPSIDMAHQVLGTLDFVPGRDIDPRLFICVEEVDDSNPNNGGENRVEISELRVLGLSDWTTDTNPSDLGSIDDGQEIDFDSAPYFTIQAVVEVDGQIVPNTYPAGSEAFFRIRFEAERTDGQALPYGRDRVTQPMHAPFVINYTRDDANGVEQEIYFWFRGDERIAGEYSIKATPVDIDTGEVIGDSIERRITFVEELSDDGNGDDNGGDDDGNDDDGDNSNPGGTDSNFACNLSNLPAVPDRNCDPSRDTNCYPEVVAPAEPTTTRTVSVSTVKEFNQAADDSGTKIIVTQDLTPDFSQPNNLTPKFPYRLNIRANDIVVEGGDHWMHNLLFKNGVKRIRIEGGKYSNIEMALPLDFSTGSAQNAPERENKDVCLDGVYVDNKNPNRVTNMAIGLRGDRIAVINSRVDRAHDIAIGAFNAHVEGTPNGNTYRHLVVAGSEFRVWSPSDNYPVDCRSTDLEPTLRFVHVEDFYAYGNFFENPCKFSNFRIHGTSRRVYATKNTLYGMGFMSCSQGEDVGIQTIFNDNKIYHTACIPQGIFHTVTFSKCDYVEARDNTVYSYEANQFRSGQDPSQTPSSWLFQNNQVPPYQAPAAGEDPFPDTVPPGYGCR